MKQRKTSVSKLKKIKKFQTFQKNRLRKLVFNRGFQVTKKDRRSFGLKGIDFEVISNNFKNENEELVQKTSSTD
jgi:hypothetical protein